MEKRQFQTGQISAQNGLHLRAEPDARSPSLEAMNYGTYVTIRKREGKWLYVTSPSGKLGWAYAAYVTGLKGFADARIALPWWRRGHNWTTAITSALIAFALAWALWPLL